MCLFVEGVSLSDVPGVICRNVALWPRTAVLQRLLLPYIPSSSLCNSLRVSVIQYFVLRCIVVSLWAISKANIAAMTNFLRKRYITDAVVVRVATVLGMPPTATVSLLILMCVCDRCLQRSECQTANPLPSVTCQRRHEKLFGRRVLFEFGITSWVLAYPGQRTTL